ncbi:MATE family efflux transporter, partial [Phocaeicola vulgatus]
IAVAGLPLFASGFIFFAVNIVSIGYFQSVERARPAMMVTVLRGFVFMVLCLLGLPLLLKVPGIWLAVPLAEILTFLVIMVIYYRKHQWVRR